METKSRLQIPSSDNEKIQRGKTPGTRLADAEVAGNTHARCDPKQANLNYG
jgi:hypothetical protein